MPRPAQQRETVCRRRFVTASVVRAETGDPLDVPSHGQEKLLMTRNLPLLISLICLTCQILHKWLVAAESW